MNRGQMGSGHYRTMGWGAVWNSSAGSFAIQKPPSAANWLICNSGQEQTATMKIIGQRRRDAGGPSSGSVSGYDFARIHKTLRITPAMAAGISDHVWSYEDIAALATI
jgi:hypothetical protein